MSGSALMERWAWLENLSLMRWHIVGEMLRGAKQRRMRRGELERQREESQKTARNHFNRCRTATKCKCAGGCLIAWWLKNQTVWDPPPIELPKMKYWSPNNCEKEVENAENHSSMRWIRPLTLQIRFIWDPTGFNIHFLICSLFISHIPTWL